MAFMEKRPPRWHAGSDRHDADDARAGGGAGGAREKAMEMGGPDKVAKQHERGKLTARERFALFFDEGQFFEVGMHGTQMGWPRGPTATTSPPPTPWCAASARSTAAWCARPRTTSP
jgi:acetyl-CoA carboxylase carboxyltransferase component